MIIKKNKKKNIVLGVSGGIAAYKSAELIRLLKKEGFNVRVTMTENATRFITPLTLATLSENEVYTDLFSQSEVRHISLAHWADLMVIVPATANIIAKIAHGIADDLLTSTILAFSGQVILAPAMHTTMITNPIYQKNAKSLLKNGYLFIHTEKGELACGDYGDGRLADPREIASFIKGKIEPDFSLNGKKILITASATREPLDQVRFISNYSTGKMGFALAEVARNRGALVTLITGPTYLTDLSGVKTIHVHTAREMEEQVRACFDHSDVFISAAAVSDFRPVHLFPGKIKKENQQWIELKLEKNPDILKEAGKKKNKQILVGFAAEVENLEKNALQKLKSKNLDYIIVNDISRSDSGFGKDTNKVSIIDKQENKIDYPLISKYEVAEHIFDRIKEGLKDQDKDIFI